jgi:diguanylate cyclase (GGDEF)-like protein
VSQQSEGKSKTLSGVLALLAVLATAAAAIFATSEITVAPALAAAVLLGLILEFRSGPLAAAGYFSLGAPLFVLLSFIHGPNTAAASPTAAACLAVAVAGISSLGRLASSSHSLSTRMAGAGVNTLRIATVAAANLAVHTAVPQHLFATVGAGYVAWVLFDLIVTSAVIGLVEEEDFKHSWRDVLEAPQNRLLLALPAAAGALGSGLGTGSEEVVAVVVTALAALPFAGALGYWLDGIKVRDQEELERQLRIAQHQSQSQKQATEKIQKENKRLSDELQSVYDMARSLGASTQLEETVGIVLSMVRRLRIPFQSCVILLYKDDNLTPVLSETPYRDVLAMSHLLQLEESLIKEVVESRRARLKPELSASSEGRIFKDERSVMCVPLIVSKEIVGVIYVGSVPVNTHNEEHLNALKMLTAFAAPSVKTAMLFDGKERDLVKVKKALAEVEAKNAQLAGLQQMGQQMGASLKASTTMKVVADSIKSMIPEAQSVILFTRDTESTDSHALKAEYPDTPYADYVRNLALRDDEGLLGKAISSSQTILVQDTEMFDVQNLLGSEHSVVVAPLFGGTEGEEGQAEEGAHAGLMGCLYVGAAKENALNEEHRNIIETVSYQTAMALKNARLYEQTQQMALTDGLTGLYTHRLFQDKLNEEIEYAERHNQPVVLVMVDADNFKTYNDTLGHPAGDALLKEIAALLKDKVRGSDIVCRYGGDEFALLLKNTRKEDAARMCERIREAFQLRFGGNAVQVTSSIGLACFPTDADSKKDLAQAADDALYVSKRGGRNRVSVSKDLATRRREGPMVQEVLKRPAELEAEKAAQAAAQAKR